MRDQRDHQTHDSSVGRRTILAAAGGSSVALAAVVVLDGRETGTWAKPIIRDAIGLPAAAASEAGPLQLFWSADEVSLRGSDAQPLTLYLTNPNATAATNLYVRIGPKSQVEPGHGNQPWAITEDENSVVFTLLTSIPPQGTVLVNIDLSYRDSYDTWPFASQIFADAHSADNSGLGQTRLAFDWEPETNGELQFESVPRPSVATTQDDWKVGDVVVGSAKPQHAQPLATWTTLQWLRNREPIPGATSSEYEITGDDVGQSLDFAVSFHRVGYQTVTRSGRLFGYILPGRMSIVTPSQLSFSGPIQPGTAMTITAGTYSPLPNAVAYEWRRGIYPDYGPIVSTASSYTLQPADDGWAIIAFTNVTAPTGYQNLSEFVDRVRVRYEES